MMNLLIQKKILSQFKNANRIALIGTGGNLAIAQHMASDIYRHTGKFCFAPDAINMTALGGDGNWKEGWLDYARTGSDLIIGITCRVESPLTRLLENESNVILLRIPSFSKNAKIYFLNTYSYAHNKPPFCLCMR